MVLRRAGPDLLAQKMVLSSALVADVLSEGRGIDLKAGGLIIDYLRPRDLFMSK